METAAERTERGGVLDGLGVFMSTGSCEASLTVLQGERGAVHRLALGWGSALGVGGRAGAVDVAAAEAGAQLQAPHVANHSRRIKSLLHTQAGDTSQDTSLCLFLFLLMLSLSCVWQHSPSICFWQSFCASVGWPIRGCSCREPCLQRSWKKMHPFRSGKLERTHANTAVPTWSMLRGAPGEYTCCFPVLTLLPHSVLCQWESFLCVMIPVVYVKATYLCQNSLAHSLTLLSSGSGLERHPNCSLKLPCF